MSLFVVATPLGNLQDISTRALNILQSADFILAEDTRRLKNLLDAFSIVKSKGQLKRFDEFASQQKLNKVLKLLGQGKSFALVTDSGTPGIADPGPKLLEAIYQSGRPVKVIPVPGPSAVTAALSVSGFPANTFVFWGYPPKKPKKQKKFFQSVIEWKDTQVLFATPHRILKDLAVLEKLGFPKERPIFIARELTKKFEILYRGALPELINQIKNSPPKGEFTIVIGPQKE